MRRTAYTATIARTRLLGGALGLLLSCFLLASAAQAAPPVTFAEFGEGAGQIGTTPGVAVEQTTGDVYVADFRNSRIDKFDADGNFLFAWGYGVANKKPELQTCGPQADPPTKRCFGGLESLKYDPRLSPENVAVDQTTGDVYVVEEFRRISKFTSAGKFLFMFGKKVNKTDETNLCTAADLETGDICGRGELGSGPGEFFEFPLSAIVDPSGHVWVGEADRLLQFDSTGGYVSEAALPAEVDGRNFARDSAGDFFAMKPGGSEVLEVTFSGFAKGDTYRLGNLPPGCSSSSTDPIQYPADTDGQIVKEALEDRCGDGVRTNGLVVGTVITIVWRGKFTDQDLGQLTCETVTGGGSCSVKTTHNGVPGKVSKLEPSGSPVNALTLLETAYTGAPYAFTLDSADRLHVADAIPPYKFKVFNQAGEQVSQFGAGQVLADPARQSAIAIGDNAKALYSIGTITDFEKFAQKFSLPDPGPLPGNERTEDLLPTTTTLLATLNPEGDATKYRFEYGTDETYGKATPEKTLPGSAYVDEEIEAAIDHLLPETTYHFRVLATNHCNNAEPAEVCTVEGEDTTFTTPPAVRIDSQSASDVSARNASLYGELDPLGVPATWWLEYGTDETYGSATPEQNLGSGIGSVAVQTVLEGLTPGTTYHYRFAARDERDGVTYTVHGPDRTLTTQVAAVGFELADERVWELVSPPNKHGAELLGPVEGVIRAAEDGEGIAYLSRGSIEADPEGNRSLEPSTVLARREAQGWRSKDITPPNERVVAVATGSPGEYDLFTPDLSQALLQPHTEVPLSPQASERTPYLRENTEPATYTPLVSGKEGFANVPPGTKFGGDGPSSAVRVVSATSDLSHVALTSSVPLALDAADGALYMWSAGLLNPISVLPTGEGGGSPVAGRIGSDEASIQRAISADGSRAFWSTGHYGPNGNNLSGLYLRDMQAGQTARLDVVQPGATGIGDAKPVFQGASADGTVAFFTASRELTEDASIGGRDLYRCEIPPGTLPPACATLTDVSAPLPGSPEKAEVLGISPAVSEDGSRIYFTAEGVLDTAPNQYGDAAVGGEPNLYLWQEGEGVRFIATLDGTVLNALGNTPDDAAWGLGGTAVAASVSSLNAAGSPSARYLSFMSQRSLTGYDNRDTESGDSLQEAFLYDAASEELRCVSCNPAGGRPAGEIPAQHGLADYHRLWIDDPVAAALPQPITRGLATFNQSRFVLDNGRVFFNAIDELVPADSNGEWDVYEHEPIGVGDCTASSGDADTARTPGGCVSLVSSGTAEEEAGFLDASASGDDVFFLSSARLSVLDEDSELDVYDVRVNGTPATLPEFPECLGEACQPAASPPSDATPASAAFQGAGNVSPQTTPTQRRCPQGKRQVRRRGKVRCVSRHKQRAKQGRHAQRSRNHGRAAR